MPYSAGRSGQKRRQHWPVRACPGGVGTSGEARMRRMMVAGGLAASLMLAGCISDSDDRPVASYSPAQSTALPPAPEPEGPTIPRIEVRLTGADSTLVRGRLATARRARGYTITVDQPAHLVAEKMLSPEDAMKRTNGASNNAAFRLDYVFNTSGGAVTVALEASIVTNPNTPREQVRPIAMPQADAQGLQQEMQDAA